MKKDQFTSGTFFYFIDSGEEYKEYFYNRANSSIMTMLAIELYQVTLITQRGFYYRGFVEVNSGKKPTDCYMKLSNLKFKAKQHEESV